MVDIDISETIKIKNLGLTLRDLKLVVFPLKNQRRVLMLKTLTSLAIVTCMAASSSMKSLNQ